jgi:hypothetical protein
MDLLVNPTPENSLRIANALSALRLTGYADDSFAKPNLQVQLKQVYYAELLTPQTGGPTYEEVAATSISAKLFYIAVRVASPGMLIALKRRAVAAGQVSAEKHMRDIEMLEAHVA